MDIRQLECFRAVLSAGSMTGAARLLGCSQPSVSRAIQDLEGTLGFALLHRSGPRISPTTAALQFHDAVDRVLAGIGHLHETARAIAGQRTPSVEIVGIPALISGLVAPSLARLEPRERPVEIHVHSLPAEKALQSVISGAAEIGLASLPLGYSGIEVLSIGEASCVAALPANDPLAAKAIVSLADFHGRPLVTMANPFRLRRLILEAFEAAGVAPDVVIDTNSGLVALQMVRAGLGIAVVEPASAYGTALADVVVRPIDTHIPFRWGAVCAVGRPPSDFTPRFIDQLHRTASELMPGHHQLDGTVTSNAIGESVE